MLDTRVFYVFMYDAFTHVCSRLQTDRSFFWWGLNFESTDLSPSSTMEAAGMIHGEDAARDRFILLKWEYLKFVLWCSP